MKTFLLPSIVFLFFVFAMLQSYATMPPEVYHQAVAIPSDQPKKYPELSVFPNPAKDIIVISNIVNHGVKEIEIFDLVGEKKKITFTSGLRDTIKVDLSNLRNGVYFIRFYDKKGKAIEMLKISKV